MSNTRMRLEILLAAIDKATAPIRSVMGSNKKLAAEVKALRDKQKDLHRVQAQIESYRKVAAQAGATGASLKQAQEKVRALTRAMQSTTAPTKEMQKALEAARKEAQSLGQQQKELQARQQALREKLKEAGVDTKKLAEHQRQLREQTKSTSEALEAQQKKLDAVNKRMQQAAAARSKYDKQMSSRNDVAGFGASMSAAGMATGMAVLGPVKEFANAEDSATQLKAAMMGAGGVVGKEYSQVVALSEKLGSTLPGTTAQFMDMNRLLIQKGLDPNVVLGGAGEATAKLAVLTKVGFEEAAGAISVFQDSMGVADKDMVSAADQMQRLFNVGMKVTEIQEGFKAMGPSLSYVRKNGIDAVKALGPLLAITDAAGMDAGSAGNAYNKIIRGSVDEEKVKKTNKSLKGTGINLNFLDKKGNFAGIDNMVNQLLKIKDLSDNKRKSVVETLFGSDKEVAEVLSALTKAGNSGIAAMKKKLAAQASLQERVAVQLGTLNNLWDAATGAFNGFMVKLGESISTELKAAIEMISVVSEKLTKWAAENPILANGIMKAAAITAIFLTAIGALSIALATILGPLIVVRYGLAMFGIKFAGVFGLIAGAVGKVIGILRVLAIFVVAHPVIAFLTALSLAAIWVWQNWGTLGPRFTTLWNGIVSFFRGLPSTFMSIGGQIIDGLVNGLSSKWESVKSKASEIANGITNSVRGALGIHSPSRVFAEIGGHTMAGLAQGLTANQTGPMSAILNTVKSLTLAGAGLSFGFAETHPAKRQSEKLAPEQTSYQTTLLGNLPNSITAMLSGIKNMMFAGNGLSLNGTPVPYAILNQAPTQNLLPVSQSMDYRGLLETIPMPFKNILDTVRNMVTGAVPSFISAVPYALPNPLQPHNLPKVDNRPPITSATYNTQQSTPATNISITINAQAGAENPQLAQMVEKAVRQALNQNQAANKRSALYDRE